MGFDASRPAIPARRLRPKITLSAPPVIPADRTRGADPEAVCRFTARYSAIDSRNNPFAKINR
jgi:hypothetical protein